MAYVPDAGDLVGLTFDPGSKAGRRPALVLSPASYNRRSELAIVCPVTSKPKGYPFEVVLGEGSAISGVILADQVKSVDWSKRKAERFWEGSDRCWAIRARVRMLTHGGSE
jgi:mRNA interferase MazF